jgi:hypothetical protein
MTVPAVEELTAIAERIRARIRRVTADIIATGNDLKMVQEKVGRSFLKWIDAEFGMTDRTARNYIQAAEWAAGKSEIISVLPPATLYKLSAPSTSEKIKVEVIADLRAGRVVDHCVIEARIADERAAARMRRKNNAWHRLRAKSPEAQRRRDLRLARIEAKAEARARAADAAAFECLAILEKLAPADLDRLRQLFEEFGPYVVMRRLGVQL